MYPILLFLLAMFIFSIRGVVIKMLTKKVSVETVMVMVAGINLLMILLAYVLFFNKKRINEDMTLLMSSENAPVMWSILVFAGMVSLGFAYVYFHMIKHHKLYHVSLLLATLPVFVLVSSYFILGEKINYKHLVAMFIIIVGLIMLETHQGILT